MPQTYLWDLIADLGYCQPVNVCSGTLRKEHATLQKTSQTTSHDHLPPCNTQASPWRSGLPAGRAGERPHPKAPHCGLSACFGRPMSEQVIFMVIPLFNVKFHKRLLLSVKLTKGV